MNTIGVHTDSKTFVVNPLFKTKRAKHEVDILTPVDGCTNASSKTCIRSHLSFSVEVKEENYKKVH